MPVETGVAPGDSSGPASAEIGERHLRWNAWSRALPGRTDVA